MCFNHRQECLCYQPETGGLQAQRKLIKIAKVAFPLGDGVTVAQQTLNLFV